MKYYLAGPMTGYPEHNYPAFVEAARKLRALGYEIVSPAEINVDMKDAKLTDDVWRHCMRKDLHELVECDGIILMHGWEKSDGATFEFEVARRLKLDMLFLFEPEAILKGVNRGPESVR